MRAIMSQKIASGLRKTNSSKTAASQPGKRTVGAGTNSLLKTPLSGEAPSIVARPANEQPPPNGEQTALTTPAITPESAAHDPWAQINERLFAVASCKLAIVPIDQIGRAS